MDHRAILFICIFLYSPHLIAAQNTSTIKIPREENYEAHRSGVSLLIPSFVIHGIKPINGAEEDMPRKMDPSGTTVLTPGIGLEYRALDGGMIMAAIFKDCYNGLAGALQMGQYYRINRDAEWGFSLGLYMRETPLTCETRMDPFGEFVEECQSLDGLDWGMKTHINNVQVDILPMPFLHFSYDVIRTREFQMQFRVMSNVALNEFGISIPF